MQRTKAAAAFYAIDEWKMIGKCMQSGRIVKNQSARKYGTCIQMCPAFVYMFLFPQSNICYGPSDIPIN